MNWMDEEIKHTGCLLLSWQTLGVTEHVDCLHINMLWGAVFILVASLQEGSNLRGLSAWCFNWLWMRPRRAEPRDSVN